MMFLLSFCPFVKRKVRFDLMWSIRSRGIHIVVENNPTVFLYISFYYVRRGALLPIRAIGDIRSMYSDPAHMGGQQ
jgi:hypothetical protein